MHLLEGNYPSLNKITKAAGHRYATATAVKLFPVYCPTGVVGGDNASGTRGVTLGTALDGLVINASRNLLNARLLRLLLQPLTVCLYVFLLCHLNAKVRNCNKCVIFASITLCRPTAQLQKQDYENKQKTEIQPDIPGLLVCPHDSPCGRNP